MACLFRSGDYIYLPICFPLRFSRIAFRICSAILCALYSLLPNTLVFGFIFFVASRKGTHFPPVRRFFFSFHHFRYPGSQSLFTSSLFVKIFFPFVFSPSPPRPPQKYYLIVSRKPLISRTCIYALCQQKQEGKGRIRVRFRFFLFPSPPISGSGSYYGTFSPILPFHLSLHLQLIFSPLFSFTFYLPTTRNAPFPLSQ